MRKFYLAFLVPLLLLSTSCTEQDHLPKVPGVDGPHLNVQNGQIILSVGLDAVRIPAGIDVRLPKMENSTASITPRVDRDTGMIRGTLIKVSFAPEDVESGDFKVVPPETLPDGRPFPFLDGDGRLPALAVNVPSLLDTTFYASERVFGFFIPVDLGDNVNIPFGLTFPLKMGKKEIGVLSYIQKNAQGDGDGIMLLLSMSQVRNNPDMQSLLKYSKRYENKMF